MASFEERLALRQELMGFNPFVNTKKRLESVEDEEEETPQSEEDTTEDDATEDEVAEESSPELVIPEASKCKKKKTKALTQESTDPFGWGWGEKKTKGEDPKVLENMKQIEKSNSSITNNKSGMSMSHVPLKKGKYEIL